MCSIEAHMCSKNEIYCTERCLLVIEKRICVVDLSFGVGAVDGEEACGRALAAQERGNLILFTSVKI